MWLEVATLIHGDYHRTEEMPLKLFLAFYRPCSMQESIVPRKKNKDFHHIATAIGWLMLLVLQNVTEKQIEAEAHTASLDEELKLERDIHLPQADNQDILRR